MNDRPNAWEIPSKAIVDHFWRKKLAAIREEIRREEREREDHS